MNLKGLELGVHWQSRKLGPFTLEANAHLGLQNYRSVQSGRLNSVLNVDTRWQALRASTVLPQWQFGLASHSHANFLQGTTSLSFRGYDRLSTHVWLAVRWHSDNSQPWAVDAGWLLWGEHFFLLSQVNPNLQDVANQQRKGVYLQISKEIHADSGDMEPYARGNWVDDSEISWGTVAPGLAIGDYEPRNNRLQVGLKWGTFSELGNC